MNNNTMTLSPGVRNCGHNNDRTVTSWPNGALTLACNVCNQTHNVAPPTSDFN